MVPVTVFVLAVSSFVLYVRPVLATAFLGGPGSAEPATACSRTLAFASSLWLHVPKEHQISLFVDSSSFAAISTR